MKPEVAKIIGSGKENKDKVKELTKKQGQRVIVKGGLNKQTVSDAIYHKSESDRHSSEKKKHDNQYNPLRDEIREDLLKSANSEHDTIEYLSEGMRVVVTPYNTDAGEIDFKKFRELLKQKGINPSSLIKKVDALKEDALFDALRNGLITHDEFLDVTIQTISHKVKVSLVEEKEKSVELESELDVKVDGKKISKMNLG